jgi:hypothetical protein
MSSPRQVLNLGSGAESPDDRVARRLARAFEEERTAAARDLTSAASTSDERSIAARLSSARSPRISRPGARSGRPRAGLVRLGAACVVAVLVSMVALGLAVWRSPAGPIAASASTTTSVGPTASADATRYEDGLPRTWEGQPVLRGQAVLDRASQSTDASPFYIGLWVTSDPVSMGCPGSAPYPLRCSDMHDVGDRAGVLWPALGKALRIDITIPGGISLPYGIPDGPFILRVHTHDRTWTSSERCAAPDLVECQHLMIGDAAVWTGDATTAPHPVSVEQAAAAFGVAPTDKGFTSVAGCLSGVLPGVRLLPFRDPKSSTGYVYGVIAVFPSKEALAGAAPDAAARGESEAFPISLQVSTPIGFWPGCAYEGVVPLHVHWLARANVLVGVGYDTTVGWPADQWVVLARTELERLPAG